MNYDVKINLRPDGNVKAYASVNLNEEFAITGVKIMEGSKGIFVSMPSYKTNKGEFKDVCFPITKNARAEFSKAVLSAYDLELSHLQTKEQTPQEMPTQTHEMNGM